MNSAVEIIHVSSFLFFSLLILWQVSMSVIETHKIKVFSPFFLIGLLFAYFAAFVFFEIFYSAGWGLLKTLEVAAFTLLLREIFRISKHE